MVPKGRSLSNGSCFKIHEAARAALRLPASSPAAADDLQPLAWQQCPWQIGRCRRRDVGQESRTADRTIMPGASPAGARYRLQHIAQVGIGAEALGERCKPVTARAGTFPAREPDDDIGIVAKPHPAMRT